MCHVSEIEIHIPNLVVAEEHVHLASCLARLLLQLEQQIHAVSLAVTPIKYVSQLHQMRLASNPCVIFTDET
jgi:hypothetical protein